MRGQQCGVRPHVCSVSCAPGEPAASLNMPLPDVVKGYTVSLSCLFLGASVVHWIYKPDLVGLTSSSLQRVSW